MAPPILLPSSLGAVAAAATDFNARSLHENHARDLQHPTHTQQVTLGVIAAYVVAIAILWNVPYLKMILWPFKVRRRLFLIHIPCICACACTVTSFVPRARRGGGGGQPGSALLC